MNARLHAVLKYLYAIFLLASGLKHLYNVYVADPTIMATGYHEAIKDFSMDEIHNANSNLRCWTEFKKTTDEDLVIKAYGGQWEPDIKPS